MTDTNRVLVGVSSGPSPLESHLFSIYEKQRREKRTHMQLTFMDKLGICVYIVHREKILQNKLYKNIFSFTFYVICNDNKIFIIIKIINLTIMH